MISVRELTRIYRSKGGTVGVTGVSFDVPDGNVVGLVGPNGAGKTTTIRSVLGLCRPDAGRALVDGRPLASWARPIYRVGAVLGPTGMMSDLSGYQNLWVLAVANGISEKRVRACLRRVGLQEHADKKVRTYSLGMRQRLSVAAALLGEAPNLVLDEPLGGLDPEGVHWMRTLLRRSASQGVSVLVSSHLLAELDAVADRYVVIHLGEVVAQGSREDIVTCSSAGPGVVVGTDAPQRVREVMDAAGWRSEWQADGRLLVLGAPSARDVAQVAQAGGVLLTHLETRRPSLEEAVLELTGTAGGRSREQDPPDGGGSTGDGQDGQERAG